jgi:homoserine dehydrogenase
MNVALIGPGLVGKAVINQLHLFNLIGVASSKLMVIGSNIAFTGCKDPVDLDAFIQHCVNNSPCILIDCTNSQIIADLYPCWISLGLHIVTPNKKGFSGPYNLFQEIIHVSRESKRFVGFEATVGAGLPIIKTLYDLVNSRDEIYSIQGVFSGTLAYLFNSYVSGSFSEIVSRAKGFGFTEPDPRDDLSGLDVARKVSFT